MYNKEEQMLIWIDSFGLSAKKIETIINISGNVLNLFSAINANKMLLESIVGSALLNKMITCANDNYLMQMENTLNKMNIKCITIKSERYPELLRNISDPPYVLYLKGNVKILNSKCIGIVGTRKPTNYGKEMASLFTKKLVQSGLVPVSGLAFGIDTCVAQTCVDLKLPTIAVLAGGLDGIYPPQNYQLSEQIVAYGGALVSEHPPLSKPYPNSFLDRNRIISGLSLGVLVVEAGYKSGARKTASDAIEQNRELFVIPGNINSYASMGCNHLINSMPEAFCTSPDQILQTLNIAINSVASKKEVMQFSLTQKMILDCLDYDEISLDDLQEKTGLDGRTMLSELTALEIAGIIKKMPGNYYAKINLPN